MELDLTLLAPTLDEMPALARAAEEVGFGTLWVGETKHNPFLPLTLAAEHTQHLRLGTAVAIAFPRSPMVTAQVAWDLQRFARGRFHLGLGTQVRAHIQRRFSTRWEAPVARLRDYIQALRAIWQAWQQRTRLNYRGRFYTFTLMTDFFDPGPNEHPHIPISIAGVNRGLVRLAGELADGFHVHPLHSPVYLRKVLLPALEEGLRAAGRTRSHVRLASTVFVITGTGAARARLREEVRRQIAFYASTPTYRVVLEVHGWAEVGERLSQLAARQQWDAMPALISDEMLAAFALEADWDDLGPALRARYHGLLDQIALYLPFDPARAEEWKRLVGRR